MLHRNILAADDSTLVLDGLDSLFSPFRRVIHALNGAIALQLARELRPHLTSAMWCCALSTASSSCVK
jgi:YesN/AraC family two-component response regulator